MVAAHLINIHVYSSIIATIALIALFVFKKGEREHIVLGYLYSLFSFITVLTIIITSALFMFGRWLDHKPFILFVGRFSDLILILLFLAQLFTGLVFIQLKDSWKNITTARTYFCINLPIFFLVTAILFGFFLDERFWNVAFCGGIFILQLPVFLFGWWLLNEVKKGKMEKKKAFVTIHSSQMISSAVTFIFMGMGANLGRLFLGTTADELRFNMKTLFVFPIAIFGLFLFYRFKKSGVFRIS